jgi:hypothetical protein
MDSKLHINKTYYGGTRKEVCMKLANEYMQRNSLAIAHHVVDLGIKEDVQYEYLWGHVDGFSMALELILSGAINLQEIIKYG